MHRRRKQQLRTVVNNPDTIVPITPAGLTAVAIGSIYCNTNASMDIAGLSDIKFTGTEPQ